MVQLEAFAVEQWMDKYETTPGVLNISETCAASVSVDDLVSLSEDKTAAHPLTSFSSRKLTYGAIRGSDTLRSNLANIYSPQAAPPISSSDIIVTPGGILANYLTLYTLIGPGDHVICIYPTYQQLFSVPASLGAEVSLWKLKEENAYIPDVIELEKLAKANTKMIIINNPNNPTGATIPKSILLKIVSFAEERGIILFSDEVYRPLLTGFSINDDEYPPSAVDMGYQKTIVTGSLSKAYALAGIRVGWVVSRDKTIIEAIASARDYTTIAVSQIDDAVASYALSKNVILGLLKRNISLAKTNLAILEKWMGKHSDAVSWVKPTAGTTAFIVFKKGGQPVNDEELCLDLLEERKVMLVPGSMCFGRGSEFKGYVRMGYVCETEVLEKGLEGLSSYLRENLA